MKIGIFSDLHIHRHDRGHDEFIDKLIGRINSFIGLDVLICAGDLSHNIDDIDNFLRAIRLDVPKYFCPGNHDLWQAAADRPFCESDSPEYRYNDLLPKIAVKNNF